MRETLDHIRRTLTDGGSHVAVITEAMRHWWEAKRFVEQVLGSPQTHTERRWTYPDGTIVDYYWRLDRRVDTRRDRPIRGFDGAVVWFGPAECDEFHCIQR